MKYAYYFVIITLLCTIVSCQNETKKATQHPTSTQPDTIITAETQRKETPLTETAKANVDTLDTWLASLPDTALIDILQLDSTFVLDVKYATTDNFTQQVLYPCQRCLLRKEVAIALVKAHQTFKELGYSIKLFDCYRPNSVQWKMWEIYPDDRYVANPAKGSVHNRGGAVDLTLINHAGIEVNMGSPYDYFGQISHFAYTDLPDSVITYRKFLREVLEKEGFGGITSEWWHFSYRNKQYAVLDLPLCD